MQAALRYAFATNHPLFDIFYAQNLQMGYNCLQRKIIGNNQRNGKGIEMPMLYHDLQFEEETSTSVVLQTIFYPIQDALR